MFRGLAHDENVYPSPFAFNPDRFMKEGKLASDIADPRDLLFGIGRRYGLIIPHVLASSNPTTNQSMSRKGDSRVAIIPIRHKYPQVVRYWTAPGR